jgi:malate dehydrogenase (oxaloacetate-decarboxylating)
VKDRDLDVLHDPLRNRGVAFTREQRRALGLAGRLPTAVLTIDQQARRAYQQLRAQPDALAKNVYLGQLHDRNETLYFRLLVEHLDELLPIVYTPTIGAAIERYSHEYRRPRGVFLSIDHPEEMREALSAGGGGAGDVDLIVVTDAESILGIGDWGVGGIEISVGKLAVYTAAGGIDPGRVIPVSLDVGTDNEALLDDPLYLGNRHPRRRGDEYDAFIAAYLETASALYPAALLHFEDFGPANARRILVEHGARFRIFNDDLHGTGSVCLAGVIAALRVSGIPMREQRVVVFGAGTAGVGIADQLRDAMVRDGAAPRAATSRVWLVDRMGLITSDMSGLRDYQRPYARPAREVRGGPVSLLDTIRRARPTILVGTSTAAGAFTREVVEAMCAATDRPVIFPMSNPTSRIEAMPADIIRWSRGRALVATGVPIEPVEHAGVTYRVGQANNALVFPGIGLGAIVSRAERVTDGMLLAAANAVAGLVDVSVPGASLLPPVSDLRAASAVVAEAVVVAAVADGVARVSPADPARAVANAMWRPVYPDM